MLERRRYSDTLFKIKTSEAVADRGGVWGVQTPPKIRKALQNRTKLNPTVKTVKNCRI
jgi:hypothetical protein